MHRGFHGFHLGRQLLQPTHSHSLNSGAAFSLYQASQSLPSSLDEDKKRKPGQTSSSSNSLGQKTISSAPWSLLGKNANNGNGHPSLASLASAFPSRLSSPAPVTSSAKPAATKSAEPKSTDPLATLGLELLRTSDSESVASFDPFSEDFSVPFAVDLELLSALTGTSSLPTLPAAPLPAPEQPQQPQQTTYAKIARKEEDRSELLKQIGKEGGWERVKRVWEEWEGRGVRVDLATRNAYLEHLGRHPSRLPLARSFFLSLPPTDRNLATYNILIKMHSVALLPDLAEEYYRAIERDGGAVKMGSGWTIGRLVPNVVSKTHLLDAYARTGQLPRALSIFSSITTSRPAPTPEQLRVAYKHLLVAHINAADLSGALSQFREMQRRRIPADPFSYALMISHAPTLPVAHQILASYPSKPNLQIYESLFSAHASHGDHPGAWSWFSRLLSSGLHPSPRTWRTIARAIVGGRIAEDEEIEGEMRDTLGVLSALGMEGPVAVPSSLASLLEHMEAAGLSKGEQERVVDGLLGVVSRGGYAGVEAVLREFKAELQKGGRRGSWR